MFASIRKQDYISIITFSLMLIAVLSLFYQYAINFSLWGDEAALANNIVERDLAELVKPLDYNQAAPLGFLLTTKLITLFLGTNEYSLRLLPFVYGLLSLLLFYQLGKMILKPALIFGMALFATSQLHVRYVAEFKQYIGDGFWALLLLCLAFKFISTHQQRILPPLIFCGMLLSGFHIQQSL